MTWRQLVLATSWVLLIPPIRPDSKGFYLGADGRLANVALEEPWSRWTVYGRYSLATECQKQQDALEARSLRLDPARADAVAFSFGRCLESDSAMLESLIENPGKRKCLRPQQLSAPLAATK